MVHAPVPLLEREAAVKSLEIGQRGLGFDAKPAAVAVFEAFSSLKPQERTRP